MEISNFVCLPYHEKNKEMKIMKIEKLLNIAYMLAVCTEGEHKYAEDECRQIFPFEKLVR